MTGLSPSPPIRRRLRPDHRFGTRTDRGLRRDPLHQLGIGTGRRPCYIETPLTNQAGGTVTIGAPDTRQDANTLTTNSGTFTWPAVGSCRSPATARSPTRREPSHVTGTMTESGGTFTQSGGTESGNPVDLNGVTLADSAGTGSFDDIGGGSTLTGTIPAGQTVTVDGRTTNVSLAVTGVTDDGTLALTSNSAGGYAQITGSGPGLTVASGGVLSTSLASAGSSTGLHRDPADQPGRRDGDHRCPRHPSGLDHPDHQRRHLQVAQWRPSDPEWQQHADQHRHPGRHRQRHRWRHLRAWGDHHRQHLGGDHGGVSPRRAPCSPRSAGPVTGTFSTLSFGANAYAVTYPSGVVTLTAENPFTVSSDALHALGERAHRDGPSGQHRECQRRFRYLLGDGQLRRRRREPGGDGQRERGHGHG